MSLEIFIKNMTDIGSAAPNKNGLNQHRLALELKKLSSAPLPLPT